MDGLDALEFGRCWASRPDLRFVRFPGLETYAHLYSPAMALIPKAFFGGMNGTDIIGLSVMPEIARRSEMSTIGRRVSDVDALPWK